MPLLLLCILLATALNAQPFTSLEENRAWVEHFRGQDQMHRLSMLKKRMLADTNLFVSWYGDRVMLPSVRAATTTVGPCRPLLLVNGRAVSISNDTGPAALLKLTSLLTIGNIDSIVIAADEIAGPIYGTMGEQCGVIIISPKTRRIGKKML
jgi:hypothetical protein